MQVLAVVIVLLLVASACDSEESGTSDPVLQPGDREVGSVEIDGTRIEYVVVVPAGFGPGDTAPVLLALPPGGQDLGLTTSIARETYQVEALARGWVVVSPAAPDGQLFFAGSETLIPGFLDWIETWVRPEGGGVHLAGISNGGISAFRIAGQNPDRVLSVVVFPGFPKSYEDQSALAELTDVPVRMYAGENDTGWVSAMEQAEGVLRDLGGDVRFEVVPDEGHVISALRDGRRVFDDLDAAR